MTVARVYPSYSTLATISGNPKSNVKNHKSWHRTIQIETNNFLLKNPLPRIAIVPLLNF